MKKTRKTQKGFTLIEVLVAIAIFMIFITSISSSYLDIARSQRQANAVRAVYSEMRYIFDLIGDEARSKTIDYGCPGSVGQKVDESEIGFAKKQQETSPGCLALNGVPQTDYLALVNDEGTQRTIFIIEEENGNDSKKLYYYKEEKEADSYVWNKAEGFENGEVEIDLQNIQLDNFVFEISPLVDPFDVDNIGCGAIQFQPAVSMYASISSINDQAGNFTLDLQTSVSSRVYNRQTNL